MRDQTGPSWDPTQGEKRRQQHCEFSWGLDTKYEELESFWDKYTVEKSILKVGKQAGEELFLWAKFKDGKSPGEL